MIAAKRDLKEDLGSRRQCSKCRTLFYDLNKDAASCPRCGRAVAKRTSLYLTVPWEAGASDPGTETPDTADAPDGFPAGFPAGFNDNAPVLDSFEDEELEGPAAALWLVENEDDEEEDSDSEGEDDDPDE